MALGMEKKGKLKGKNLKKKHSKQSGVFLLPVAIECFKGGLSTTPLVS